MNSVENLVFVFVSRSSSENTTLFKRNKLSREVLSQGDLELEGTGELPSDALTVINRLSSVAKAELCERYEELLGNSPLIVKGFKLEDILVSQLAHLQAIRDQPEVDDTLSVLAHQILHGTLAEGAKSQLFVRTHRFALSQFESLMLRQDRTPVFDSLMNSLSIPKLNRRALWKEQIYGFGFSTRRCAVLYIQDEEVDFIAQAALHKIDQGPHGSFRSSHSFDDIQAKRVGVSNTINSQNVDSEKAKSQWAKADVIVKRKAREHRGTDCFLSFDILRELHKILGVGQEEIKEPGETRKGYVSLGGAGHRGRLTPYQLLDEHIDAFDRWSREQFLLCNSGAVHPVVLAARVYERVVTIHPFENGNGRVSRLGMDYVLERYQLPPPSLGETNNDVRDAALPLKSRGERRSFLLKVISGVRDTQSLI